MNSITWYKRLTLALILLWALPVKSQEFSDIDAMGNAIYEAFKTHQSEKLDPYLPTVTDVQFAEGIYGYFDSDTMDAKELQTFVEKGAEDTRKSFERIWNETNENKIRLSRSTLKRVDFTVKKTGKKIEADVLIVFEFITDLYEIRLRKCFKTDRGWVVGKSFSWGKGYDINAAPSICDCLKMDSEGDDSIREACNELAKTYDGREDELMEEIKKCKDF